MINTDTFRELALLLPVATEQPHFENTSFRVNKKIFATLDIKNSLACLKLRLVDQGVFSLVNNNAIYPVPNKLGTQGWTYVNLKRVRKNTLVDALTTAYFNAANNHKKNHK